MGARAAQQTAMSGSDDLAAVVLVSTVEYGKKSRQCGDIISEVTLSQCHLIVR